MESPDTLRESSGLSMAALIWTCLLPFVSYVAFSVYRNRVKIYRLKEAGYPMPEWSWIFGHLLALKPYTDRLPSDTFITTAMRNMAKDFTETDMFYLDLWPFTTPVLVICEADAAMQATTGNPFPKADSFNVVFGPIMGGPNLLSMNDQEWKQWRALFNPGFGPGYLMELVPTILQPIETFVGKLRERANTVFCLEELATRMTMDIIVKVTLEEDMDYQNSSNPLADSLRAMIRWTSFGNFLIRHNPFRPLIMKYYGGIANAYIQKATRRRWEEFRSEKRGDDSPRQSKSAISLALASYMSNVHEDKPRDAKLDEHFAAYAQYRIRLFLFAGHDTTTGMLVYTFHMLSRHPDVLRRVQKEHDLVFGSDPEEAGNSLRERPSSLNQLAYTLAVIKETMRLYAPSGAVRDGVPGRFLTDRHGSRYPTEGIHLSIMHTAIHDNPRLWPRPRDFLPERWLAQPGDPLYPVNGAWRVFEVGPRNCIGQTLAITELRLALVMTVRTISIKPAYEEWDVIRNKSLIERFKEALGSKPGTPPTVDGDRAYPIERGGAHPKDWYPCTVSMI